MALFFTAKVKFNFMGVTKTSLRTNLNRFTKLLEDKCFAARMTQAALAERLGIDERTLRRRKRDGLWTYPQMLKIFRVLRYTEEEKRGLI